MGLLFKICHRCDWQAAEAAGMYRGSAVDLVDGFIHLSAAHQVRETAARHFADQGDLLLVAVKAEGLGAGLRWEASRGGDLFPHVYGPLLLHAVAWIAALPLHEGAHVFPDLAE